MPHLIFKRRQRYGLKFLKTQEIKCIINTETLKIGMSLNDRIKHLWKQFQRSKIGYMLVSKV
jgi:hypothetical protein